MVQHSLVSLLVLLTSKCGDGGRHDVADLARRLVRQFAEVDAACRDEVQKIAPSVLGGVVGEDGGEELGVRLDGQGVAWTGGEGQGRGTDVEGVGLSEADKRKALAKARQEAMLAQMRAAQAKFAASMGMPMDTDSEEEREEGGPLVVGEGVSPSSLQPRETAEREIGCALCRESGPSAGLLCMITFVQCSKILDIAGGPLPSWQKGLSREETLASTADLAAGQRMSRAAGGRAHDEMAEEELQEMWQWMQTEVRATADAQWRQGLDLLRILAPFLPPATLVAAQTNGRNALPPGLPGQIGPAPDPDEVPDDLDDEVDVRPMQEEGNNNITTTAADAGQSAHMMPYAADLDEDPVALDQIMTRSGPSAQSGDNREDVYAMPAAPTCPATPSAAAANVSVPPRPWWRQLAAAPEEFALAGGAGSVAYAIDQSLLVVLVEYVATVARQRKDRSQRNLNVAAAAPPTIPMAPGVAGGVGFGAPVMIPLQVQPIPGGRMAMVGDRLIQLVGFERGGALAAPLAGAHLLGGGAGGGGQMGRGGDRGETREGRRFRFSSAPNNRGDEGRSTSESPVGLHVSACGHAIHQGCLDRYFTSLVQRYISRAPFEGVHIVDPEMGEFLCPMCRCLANSTLPAISASEAARLAHSAPLRPSIASILAEDDGAGVSECNDCAIAAGATPTSPAIAALERAGEVLLRAESLIQKVGFRKASIPPLPEGVRSNLEMFVMRLCALGRQDIKEAVPALMQGREHQGLKLWEALWYNIASSELALRARTPPPQGAWGSSSSSPCVRPNWTASAVELHLSSLSSATEGGRGSALSALFQAAKMQRAHSRQAVLLRARGLQLLIGSVLRATSLDHMPKRAFPPKWVSSETQSMESCARTVFWVSSASHPEVNSNNTTTTPTTTSPEEEGEADGSPKPTSIEAEMPSAGPDDGMVSGGPVVESPVPAAVQTYLEQHRDGEDVRFWGAVSLPVLSQDAFVSLARTVYCLPLGLGPDTADSFRDLVALFHLVCVTQAASQTLVTGSASFGSAVDKFVAMVRGNTEELSPVMELDRSREGGEGVAAAAAVNGRFDGEVEGSAAHGIWLSSKGHVAMADSATTSSGRTALAVRRLTLPYLRRCAILYELMYGSFPMPSRGNNAGSVNGQGQVRAPADGWEWMEGEEKREEAQPGVLQGLSEEEELEEVGVLERAFGLVDLEELVVQEGVSGVVTQWCRHLREEARGRELKGVAKVTGATPFQLMPLPPLFHDLYQRYVKERCPRCQAVPRQPALCLFCGALCCGADREQPCCSINRHGECYRHAQKCGAGIGVYLLLKRTTVLLIRGERRAMWPSPYLDIYGEEDVDIKRGKPLYLQEERYAALTSMVASHGLDQSSLVLSLTSRSTH